MVTVLPKLWLAKQLWVIKYFKVSTENVRIVPLKICPKIGYEDFTKPSLSQLIMIHTSTTTSVTLGKGN
jgi:hypothetical protein